MPQIAGRPTARITIEDCASCLITANPRSQCPHGLDWRPSRWEAPRAAATATKEEREALERFIASVCADPACEATEYRPHEGQRIVLQAPRDVAWRIELDDRRQAADGNQRRLVELAYGILADVLVEWTWTGIDGEKLPHPNEDGALERIRQNTEGVEALWIIQVLTEGGDPAAVADARGNGDAGSPNT